MTDRDKALALLARSNDVGELVEAIVAALRAARAEGFAIARDNASAVDGCSEGCCGPSIDWDDAARLLAGPPMTKRSTVHVIHKYTLNPTPGAQVVLIPPRPHVLTCQMQGHWPTLWCVVEKGLTPIETQVVLLFTGDEVPSSCGPTTYVGTVTSGIGFVYHVFVPEAAGVGNVPNQSFPPFIKPT